MAPEPSGGDAPTAPPRRPIDLSKIAYQLPQPMGMVPDALIAGGLVLDGDERGWVPQSPAVSFKPLLLNVTQGYYISILRVRASGVLSRHRHHGAVHAFTLRGTWRYLEHDWVESAGTMRSSRLEKRARSSSRAMFTRWRRCFTSLAARPISILMGSRWATRTCSPNSNTQSGTTSRSVSEKITYGG